VKHFTAEGEGPEGFSIEASVVCFADASGGCSSRDSIEGCLHWTSFGIAVTQEDCSYLEHSVAGMKAITIENAFLSATILPEKGADIYSFVYKPRSLDVLWKSPWGLRKPGSTLAAASSETAWLDHYEGGWQELFPNGGDACVYRGAALNFHGEASVSGWDYIVARATASTVAVEFVIDLARSPFRLRRTMYVEKLLPALIFEERIENRGEEDLHFMWGHHPALGAPFLRSGCRLQVPARTFLAHEVEVAPTSRIAAATRGAWPVLGGREGREVDLSIVPPVIDRVTEFGYICDLEDGWYGVSNDSLGAGFGMAWPREVFPFLWFWQELRGSFGYPWYGRCYVMAVEPFTSIPGSGLTRAMESGTAPLLAAGASVEARLAAVFFEPGDVESIDLEGTVHLRQRPART
jgi:hypothetical protein